MVKFLILWYPWYAHCSPWPTKGGVNRIIDAKMREGEFTLVLVSHDCQRIVMLISALEKENYDVKLQIVKKKRKSDMASTLNT